MNKIIYLDAAASALKPAAVVDAQVDFLRHKYANAGRGICARVAAVDNMVADARRTVGEWIHAAPYQIVFTSGTTDAMNRIVGMVRQLPVFSARRPVVGVSDLDHHSARMPWQHLANGGVCDIAVCPLDADFNIDVAQLPVADVLRHKNKLARQVARFLFDVARCDPVEIRDLKPRPNMRPGYMCGWCQGDICDNFIINPKTWDIVAFIDWEDCAFGDFSHLLDWDQRSPARELMAAVRAEYKKLYDASQKK